MAGVHYNLWCNGQNLAIAPLWITRVTNHTERWDMFHNLAHILSYNCWKYRVDTPPLPRDMQSGAKCIFSYSLPFWITRVANHTERWDMFHNSARILSCMCWKYRVDTPPLPQDMQSGAKCILSHTLTVVVQWPNFGHSTTLNNKGYKPHREMRHVS